MTVPGTALVAGLTMCPRRHTKAACRHRQQAATKDQVTGTGQRPGQPPNPVGHACLGITRSARDR